MLARELSGTSLSMRNAERECAVLTRSLRKTIFCFLWKLIFLQFLFSLDSNVDCFKGKSILCHAAQVSLDRGRFYLTCTCIVVLID